MAPPVRISGNSYKAGPLLEHSGNVASNGPFNYVVVPQTVNGANVSNALNAAKGDWVRSQAYDIQNEAQVVGLVGFELGEDTQAFRDTLGI